MTEQTTIDPNAGTSADTLTAPAVVTIPATQATPAVTISSEEHQFLADLKAGNVKEGFHDLVALFEAAVAKI